MPDRYADAVRARRTELLAARALLDGTHRAELRSELALSRIAASDAVGRQLGRLAREVRSHVENADRSARERLPELLTAALDALAARVHGRWAAELRPAVLRIASARSLAVEPGWPRVPGPRLPVVDRGSWPAPVRPGSLLAGAADGVALWRLVLLPLAALPLLGLPALGGPALAPLAVGAGVAATVVAVRSRRTALQRAALRRGADEVLAAARSALEADIGRRVLELERSAVAVLDAAVARRRAVVDAELRTLAPDRPGGRVVIDRRPGTDQEAVGTGG